MRPITTPALLLAAALHGQDCTIPFTDSLFATHVEHDLWYGNAPRFDGGTDSLHLDLYKPAGDGQTVRPLVVLIHGGGFHAGHRTELATLAEDLAERGWVAATISYRLGFYGSWLFAPPYANDPSEVRRAIYRAQQDARGAIRFLKGRHQLDSTSTSAVFTLGFSAGAITALHAAYLDRSAEKPADCGAIAPVQHFLNTYPRPDLGDIQGDLEQNGHDANVMGVVNFYGALMDTAYMESPNDPALFSYHQTNDPVVGCGLQRPYWGLGLGLPDNNPYLYGSCAIDTRVQHLGFAPGRYRVVLHQGDAHTVHDPPALSAQAMQWMRDLFCDLTTAIGTPTSPQASLVPNPAHRTVAITTGTSTPTHFDLRDTRGRTLQQGTITGGHTDLDLSALPCGVYIVRLHGADGPAHLRLVKE